MQEDLRRPPELARGSGGAARLQPIGAVRPGALPCSVDAARWTGRVAAVCVYCSSSAAVAAGHVAAARAFGHGTGRARPRARVGRGPGRASWARCRRAARAAGGRTVGIIPEALQAPRDRRPRGRRAGRHARHGHPQGGDGPAGRRVRRPPGRLRHARGAPRAAHPPAAALPRQADRARRRRRVLAAAARRSSSTCTRSGSPAPRAATPTWWSTVPRLRSRRSTPARRRAVDLPGSGSRPGSFAVDRPRRRPTVRPTAGRPGPRARARPRGRGRR